MLFRVFFLLFSCLIFFSGLLFAKTLKESQSRPLLGTIVKVDVCYASGQEPLLKESMGKVWQRMEEIHTRMNRFDEKSDVSLINSAEGKAIQIHEDVYRLLKASKRYFETTQGVLDVAVGPLVALWHRVEKEDRYPTAEEVAGVKSKTDVNKILLGAGTAQLQDKDMKIDLNSVVSGFAADEAVAVLRQDGFKDFLVDAGGEIFASGMNCEGKPWRVGVKDPLDGSKFIDTIELTDAAISTSGDYESFYQIKDKRLSHIINPVTGYPADFVTSATVVAPNATDADALSTAFCVLPPQDSLKLVESLGQGYSALIFVHKASGGLERYTTSGYERLKVKQ